jgi:hypothetical protein
VPWRATAFEDLDDDHATAAAWTSGLAGIDSGSGGLAFRFCNCEQLTRARDIVGARAFGEQAVVTNAVQTLGQDVDQEAADELVCGERHALVSMATAIGGVELAGNRRGNPADALDRQSNRLDRAEERHAAILPSVILLAVRQQTELN